MGFGSIVNSKLKIQTLYFDCKDVNFTDGTYKTDIVLKNNSVTNITSQKFFQDVSAMPLIIFALIVDTAAPQTHIIDFNTPISTPPNVFANQFTGNISCINNNNCTVSVFISGLTGTGITALSFEVAISYFEIDF